MKIKGPTNGATPVDGVSEVEGADGVGGIAPAEAPAVTGPSAAGSTAPTDEVGKVAARLRAGEITVDQAVELLIDDAVERQIGRATAEAKELEPKLRELLRGYAMNDPFLVAKIRRLTLAK